MLSDPKLWLPPFHRIPLLSVDPSKVERTEVIAWINFFVLSCFHVCLVLNNFEPSYCRRPAPWQFIYISKSLTYSATGLSSKNDTIWTWLASGCLLITSALSAGVNSKLIYNRITSKIQKYRVCVSMHDLIRQSMPCYIRHSIHNYLHGIHAAFLIPRQVCWVEYSVGTSVLHWYSIPLLCRHGRAIKSINIVRWWT